ncbi:Zinc finger MYM-type protein 1 [Aphis craccivora]|uniref:Zinc finger MYM-type protein 1 n=1 Tax=Aphis craccivora TaxID=307492 RepID=A0A6G0YKG1_APHCR|nr:Zinc finger MYM-type protein 1 [Aphis craccivora]
MRSRFGRRDCCGTKKRGCQRARQDAPQSCNALRRFAPYCGIPSSSKGRIDAIGRLIELKTKEFDIVSLSLKFVLNSDELGKSSTFFARFCSRTIKTIHQWLEKLSTSKNFVNVNKALKLIITIPVTGSSCERAYSKLSLVKTKLRSRMLQERLDAIMFINYNDIIDELKHLHPFDRRSE